MFAFRRRSDYFLAVVDLATGLLAGLIAYSLRFGDTSLSGYYVARYEGMTVGLAVGFVVAARAAGLYRRAALRPGESNTEAAVEASLAVGLAVFLINQFGLNAALSRSWVGLVTLALLLLSLLSRALVRASRRALVPLGIGLERYALVGDDAAGRRLLADLTRASGAPYVVVEVLPRGLSPEELLTKARSATRRSDSDWRHRAGGRRPFGECGVRRGRRRASRTRLVRAGDAGRQYCDAAWRSATSGNWAIATTARYPYEVSWS